LPSSIGASRVKPHIISKLRISITRGHAIEKQMEGREVFSFLDFTVPS
jgi:hypothetical protein